MPGKNPAGELLMDVTFPRAVPFPHGVGVLIYYVIKAVFFQAAFKDLPWGFTRLGSKPSGTP